MLQLLRLGNRKPQGRFSQGCYPALTHTLCGRHAAPTLRPSQARISPPHLVPYTPALPAGFHPTLQPSFDPGLSIQALLTSARPSDLGRPASWPLLASVPSPHHLAPKQVPASPGP